MSKDKSKGKEKKVVKMNQRGVTVKPTDKEAHVAPLEDKDIERWAYHFTGRTEEEGALDKVQKMATRVANIGDITALAQFFDNANKSEINRQLNTIVQRLTIMEYIINEKLGVTNEEMGEYVEKYEKEMDELRKAMEEMMAEEGEGEEDTKDEPDVE